MVPKAVTGFTTSARKEGGGEVIGGRGRKRKEKWGQTNGTRPGKERGEVGQPR